jgi:hypothetical protein
VKCEGWDAKLYNELAAPSAGKIVRVPVYIKALPGCTKRAEIIVSAVSESNAACVSRASKKLWRTNTF